MARPSHHNHETDGPSRPRRVNIMNSNEDIFLNLAKDEPNNGQAVDIEGQAAPRTTSKFTIAKPTGSSNNNNNNIYSRRSASAQLSTTAQPGADDSRVRQRPSRTSLAAAVPEYLRDPPSSRAFLSTNEHPVRRSPSSFSRAFLPAAGNFSPEAGLSERSYTSAGGAAGVAKSHHRTNFRPSNLAYLTPTSNGTLYPTQPLSSHETMPALQSPTDGGESVGSTTAASTVWDELEELRLRIRRLEHSGNQARSAAIAPDEAADRPHTATTMTTTSSVSHPLKRLASPSAKAARSSNAPSHPLLQAALAKSRDVVEPATFECLVASVSDAMALSMLIADTEPARNLNESNSTLTLDTISHKKLRRKTDSLCRSLTELCIALCEDGPRQRYQNIQRPGSRESPLNETVRESQHSPLTYLDERRARLDRSGSAPHRPYSRVSGYAAGSVTESTRQQNNSTLAPRQSLTSRLDRRRYSSSAKDNEGDTVIRSISRAATDFSQDDSEDHDLTVRAPSRAMSEAQSARRNPSSDLQKFSREYTSRHPLPGRLAPSTRQQPFETSNESMASFNTTRNLSASPRPFLGSESRPLEPSPTLAERLARRRQQQQQQQQQAATSGQLDEINLSEHSYTAYESRRPASSGRASKYNPTPLPDSEPWQS